MGAYARITSDYPAEGILQHQTGDVVALLTKGYPDECLVKLDGGITRNPHLEGQLISVPIGWLERVNRLNRKY